MYFSGIKNLDVIEIVIFSAVVHGKDTLNCI